MEAPRPARVLQAAGIDAVVLGAVGFLCGFLGPIALSPDANQGPLLGIFITGPGGAVAGLLLGIVLGALEVSRATARVARVTAALVVAGVTLFFSTPEPEYRAGIVEGEVRGCAPPASMKEQALERWEQALSRSTGAEPRPGWREDLERMLLENRGVVLRMAVSRQTAVYENRKPWNRGTLHARPWKAGERERSYFASYAGGSCESYPLGERTTYAVTGQTSRAWPPEILANLLGLSTVEPLSAAYSRLVQ